MAVKTTMPTFKPAIDKPLMCMIDAAAAAVANLKSNPRPSPLRPNDRTLWTRQAQTMLSFFGIKIDKTGGPTEDSRNNLDYVENIFSQLKAGMDTDEHPDYRRPALYCGLDGWRYYRPDERDPVLQYLPIGQRVDQAGQPIFPNGAWYFNTKYLKFQPTCGPNMLAWTAGWIDVITFCDYSFRTQPVIIDSTAANPDRYAWLNDRAGTRNAMSVSWVHELAHFYGTHRAPELIDYPAVNSEGVPIDGEKTYGVGSVMNLAKHDPNSASRTADAYAWFATAMFLSKWNWSQGFAERKVQGRLMTDLAGVGGS
ncbi:Hypothetical protein D9617_19g103120 [Elsinoe fawcettii]|nr:Hypothetical protein D9617_19g103120 [Elsinoe fawcettii]